MSEEQLAREGTVFPAGEPRLTLPRDTDPGGGSGLGAISVGQHPPAGTSAQALTELGVPPRVSESSPSPLKLLSFYDQASLVQADSISTGALSRIVSGSAVDAGGALSESSVMNGSGTCAERRSSALNQEQQHPQAAAAAAAAAAVAAAAASAAVSAVTPGGVLAANNRPSARKAWYLDAAENDASPALLAELGIIFHTVHLENGSADVNVQLWKLAQSRLAVSSKSNGDVTDRGAIQIGDLPATTFLHDDMEDQGGEARFDSLEGMYCVWGGEAFVDVRDWADCWVRVRLQPGDVVVIPPNRFHRATPKSPGARLVQVRVKTGDGNVNVDIRDPRSAPTPGSSGTMSTDPRELVSSLCRQFYHLGWVTGTGGSISIKHGNRVFMTPSGVQKERLRASDLFVLDRQGTVLQHPWSAGGKRLKISACNTLFQHAYRLRGAGAVIHTHGMYCVLGAMICERKGLKEFRITHQEMIKGMVGHGYHDDLVIPVIDNTAKEEDLADSLAEAITKYPKSNAVLVQRHGCYVWGPTWEKAKTQSECLHYLLEVAVKMEQIGFDPAALPLGMSTAPKTPAALPASVGASYNGRFNSGANGFAGTGGSTPQTVGDGHGRVASIASVGMPASSSASGMGGEKRKRLDGTGGASKTRGDEMDTGVVVSPLAVSLSTPLGGQVAPPTISLEGTKVVLLDIEGTTTPITFVHDTLFPYAREHLDQHLRSNWQDAELQGLVGQLATQAVLDAESGQPGVPQILDAVGVGLECAQASIAEYVRFVMASDRKLGAMKALQGHIWRGGYASGGLTGEVYPDVLPALRRWTRMGKRVAIYSSGSREAQRLLFGHSTAGDLRTYLTAYFDTSVGGKREDSSYREISLSMGVDAPSEILFVTDLLPEAEAAQRSGLRAVLSVRPGNAPQPDGHSFTIINDFNCIN